MAKEVAPAAFTSSMVHFFNSQNLRRNYFPLLRDQWRNLLLSTHKKMNNCCLLYIFFPIIFNWNLQLFEFPDKLIDSLKDINGLKLKYKETLQNKLIYFLQEKRIEEME
jgi:hypothetical protein